MILGDCEGVKVDFARLTGLCSGKGERCSPTCAEPVIAADRIIVADEMRWNRLAGNWFQDKLISDATKGDFVSACFMRTDHNLPYRAVLLRWHFVSTSPCAPPVLP